MSTQHTPGPWVAVTSWGDTFIQNAEGDIVFFLSVEDGVKTADLKLMAAAPELLEALKNIVNVGLSTSCIADARAAITKATGGKA